MYLGVISKLDYDTNEISVHFKGSDDAMLKSSKGIAEVLFNTAEWLCASFIWVFLFPSPKS